MIYNYVGSVLFTLRGGYWFSSCREFLPKT